MSVICRLTKRFLYFFGKFSVKSIKQRNSGECNEFGIIISWNQLFPYELDYLVLTYIQYIHCTLISRNISRLKVNFRFFILRGDTHHTESSRKYAFEIPNSILRKWPIFHDLNSIVDLTKKVALNFVLKYQGDVF